MRHRLQCVSLILASGANFRAAQCISETRRHISSKKGRESSLLDPSGFVLRRTKVRSRRCVRAIPFYQHFARMDLRLVKTRVHLLIVEVALRADRQSKPTDSPVSCKKLDDSKLNRVNNNSEPDAQECQDSETGDPG